jgi:hypothetical protein
MANPRFSMNFMILAGTPHKISWFQSFFSRQSNGYCDYQVKQPNGLCTLGKDRPEICPDFVKETLLLRLSTCEPGMHVSQALAAFSSWLHDVPCVLQLHGAHLPRWVLTVLRPITFSKPGIENRLAIHRSQGPLEPGSSNNSPSAPRSTA